MGLWNNILVVFFSLVQVVVLTLGITSVVTPLWTDPEHGNQPFLQNKHKEEEVHHAGLWQICFDEILANTTDENSRFGLDELRDSEVFGKAFQGAYTAVSDDSCTQDGIENFYKLDEYWGDSMWARLIIVRVFSIVFLISGFIKFFTVIAEQCSEGEKGWKVWIGSLVVSILEFASGVVVIAIWSTMMISAADEAKFRNRENYEDFRDYTGASYWFFMVAVALTLVPDISLCV
eukprot:TRINITY_DN3484_c0_g2_i1.p1 TRINITY_DN3484_c0_g2~~TRINITY_DN3484_c0_g2_i1.p1  ORF type:complete len:254 (-),score=21.99 TRINITY_DN3484_c0_g2_i1:1061-1759(-)